MFTRGGEGRGGLKKNRVSCKSVRIYENHEIECLGEFSPISNVSYTIPLFRQQSNAGNFFEKMDHFFSEVISIRFSSILSVESSFSLSHVFFSPRTSKKSTSTSIYDISCMVFCTHSPSIPNQLSIMKIISTTQWGYIYDREADDFLFNFLPLSQHSTYQDSQVRYSKEIDQKKKKKGRRGKIAAYKRVGHNYRLPYNPSFPNYRSIWSASRLPLVYAKYQMIPTRNSLFMAHILS